MKLKKKRKNRTETITIRCTQKEKNRIKTKALQWANGNVSEWLLYAGGKHVPKRSDLEK